MSKIKTKFKFNNTNLLKAKKILEKYPKNFSSSAVLPLLHLAQEQLDGWLDTSSVEYISNYLNVPLIKVYEVATFYHMFNLKKVGKKCINVCTTTPCWLVGSDSILKRFEKKLNIKTDCITKDGSISLHEIECLGACINGPVIKINNDYHENIKLDDVDKIVKNLKK